jgi:hypothetical protein
MVLWLLSGRGLGLDASIGLEQFCRLRHLFLKGFRKGDLELAWSLPFMALGRR